MKRLLTTVMVIGLTLSVQAAFADDASGPVLLVSPINRAKVDAQVVGDTSGQTADILTLTAPNAFVPNSYEFRPDGRGNMIFTATAPVKTEKGAFLGIYTTRAPAVLREHMKLKAGLVVDRVKPKSPADIAGLKPLDVVEKLDDQWLINPDQLLGLLRMHKPGDTVSLSIFHKGDRQTLKVKLDEQDVPVIDDESQLDLPGTLMIDRLVDKIRMDRLPNGPGAMRSIKIIKANSDSANGDAAYQDNGIMLRSIYNDGHTSLTATDKSGKTIFNGPIDTQQEREVAERGSAKNGEAGKAPGRRGSERRAS